LVATSKYNEQDNTHYSPLICFMLLQFRTYYVTDETSVLPASLKLIFVFCSEEDAFLLTEAIKTELNFYNLNMYRNLFSYNNSK
jgi:hypothetical protein